MSSEVKPEWFEMADADRIAYPTIRPVAERQAKAPFRLMAITAPLLAIGAGLFLAQSQEVPNATAANSTAIVAPAPVKPAPVQSAPVTTAAPAVATTVQSTPVQTPVAASNGLTLPAKSISAVNGEGDDLEGDD